MRKSEGSDAILFAEKVLALLDEGRFTATYKYAVLLGLMDLCLEQTSRSGEAPAFVTTAQLAERVVNLYWPHTAPFGAAHAAVLRQNTMGQAEIVSIIRRFRDRHLPDPHAPLARARAASPAAFESMVRSVEWKLVEMPLPRLQQIGVTPDRFIYEVAWSTTIRRAEFADGTSFDNRIQFVGAAGEHLVRLSGLLRPLVQRQWAALVARINDDLVADAHLEAFLFGADRIRLDPVRGPLRDLQSGRCFYCDRRLTEAVEVDHFLPWSRHPDDGIDNLVAADGRCNGDKRDFLASAEHVERWADRNHRQAGALATIATVARWSRTPDRTLSVARAVYVRLRPEVQLWRAGREFVPADQGRLVAALAGAAL